MSSSTMICSAEWKTLVADNRKAKGLSRKQLADAVGISDGYVDNFETKGWVPRRNVVEAIAKKLEVPAEDALLACGYSNQNIVRGYRRYLDAIKTNTPMKPGAISTKTTRPSPKDLVAALSELASEFDGLRAENQQMSTKLSKIQAAFA